MAWEINKTDELWEWFQGLDRASQLRVIEAIDLLAETGPALGRPLVDTLKGARVANLKELRPGSSGRSEIRILFAFDPWREAILLIGGDKSGNWSGWYREWIPWAEARYEQYLKEREAEEGQR
ncbi:addiction module toxin RelE [Nonomuraea turkmeniaca]|uniref:Addiction module toxin RelE n=1 Tax=Nonomuraea turkmeniaca TaxID=103838 RepID=A0A5S4EZ03_9ACTN|nr:type II toxin-antitoxin system RelE/ParE family toxin [Nonomuraea turkmeniaca]TMR08803.1 addiction module toxin RelE [Nonomuraea turkmeniaca]